MAVEDGIARRVIAIAGTAKLDAVAEGGAGRDGLRIQVSRVGVAGVQHPLMGVQMKDVGFLGAGVKVAETHRIAQIGMVNIGRIVRVHGADWFFTLFVPPQNQGGIPVGPGAEKEFLGPAFGAFGDHADRPLRLGAHDGGSHAGDTVVDAHAVLDVMQRVVLVRQFGEGLLGVNLVVHDDGEFAERKPAAVAEHTHSAFFL